jgi:hypothetical protein
MTKKDILVGIALFVTLLVGVNFPLNGTTVVERIKEVSVGGVSQDEYAKKFFHEVISEGGAWYATTSTSGTYLASTIANSKLITETGASAVTRTLPTRDALNGAGFLPNVGDTGSLYIFASTSAVTLAGNSGVLLHGMGTTTLAIMASSTARLDFVRMNSTNGSVYEVLITTD